MAGDKRFRLPLILAALVAILDQASKWWVVKTLSPGQEQEVIPGFFNLVHVHNFGAAFSFLNRGGIGWQRYFFIAVSILAVCLILYLIKTARGGNKLLFIGYGLIMGGALGNLVDRVRVGHVTDFLDVYVGKYHWPSFNVADSGISVGACCLILSLLFWNKSANA